MQKLNYKKLLLSFVLLGISFTTIQRAQAETMDEETLQSTPIESQGVVDSPGNSYLGSCQNVYDGEKITQRCSGTIYGTIEKALSLLVGEVTPITDAKSGIPLETSDGRFLYLTNPGALDQSVAMQGEMYQNPPASAIVYAQQEWNMITKGHKAMAAPGDSWVYYPGLGFNVLKPIQDYWILARNLAYIAMILIIIIVAFLVAFRSNFGGQTQVTIANSIPNIIIALIMITISYPLSGLAIDMITVGSNLSQQILVQNSFSPGYETIWQQDSISSNPGGAANTTYVIEGSVGTEGKPVKYHLQPDDPAMSVWQIFGTSNVTITEGDNFANIVPDVGVIGGSIRHILEKTDSAGLAEMLLQLVFAISAFMAALKLFFKLLTKYLILLLYPVVSPFVMLTIAIPGQGTKAIAQYFKTLFSASLSFVAIYAIFLFMIVLTNDEEIISDLTYSPSLSGYNISETGGISAYYIRNILAFGLFLSTPVIPDAIDQFLAVLPSHMQQKTAGQRLAGGVISGSAFGAAQLGGLGLRGYQNLTQKPKKQ